MVSHPSEHQWSRYAFNAMGEENAILKPHLEYKRLGLTDSERQAAYRALFRAQVPKQTLEEIRESINKSNTLGSEDFIRKIGKKLSRPARTGQHGGDRKSDLFQGV
jgi:putative transposase